jgi:L-lactate dehydrogenase complex protein LldE
MAIQLFATCLGEAFYPNILKDCVALFDRLDIEVVFPEGQCCCGQPLFNSGFHNDARAVARNFLKAFPSEPRDLVSPSGSCVDMVRHHMPGLFAPDTPEHDRAADLASRTHELSEYLVRIRNIADVGARFPHKVAYHASCHLLRGLGLRSEARTLLSAVRDIELVPLDGDEECCGFGGAFSVIYPDVSRAMVELKVQAITRSGAEVVVTGDGGCLMNIAGALRTMGSPVRALHLVEVLASTGEGL